MRSALVVGATGFIGTNLARELLAAGVETWGLLRSSSPGRARVERLDGARLILVDAWDSKGLERAFGRVSVDVIFNALGAGALHDSRPPWSALLDGNVRAAVDVARLAGRVARRLVHLGTCQEYAPKPPEAGLLDESDPIDPTSDYGASKAAAALLVSHVCRAAGIEHVHARLFNTYGTFEAESRLIPHLVRRLERGEPAELTDGEQVRDFTFVADVCKALTRLGDCRLGGPAEVFNVCSGTGIAVRDLILAVAESLGASPRLLRFGARPQRRDEPAHVVGSNARLVAATGWMPEIPLDEGIRRTLAGCRGSGGRATS